MKATLLHVALALTLFYLAALSQGCGSDAPTSDDASHGDPDSGVVEAGVVIHVDDLAPATPIDQRIFGAFVPSNSLGGYYTQSVLATSDWLAERGVKSVRSYGCDADIYHWRDMVGPVHRRKIFAHANTCFAGFVNQLYDVGTFYTPDLTWGVDEVFEFAAAGGAEMVGTVNFGTGTAQEAANFVEYANIPSPDPDCDGADGLMINGWTPDSFSGGDAAPSGYFACLRHYFGREAPYGIRFWEVGNEINGGSSPTWTGRTEPYYNGGTESISPGYVTRDPDRYDWSGNYRQTTCEPNQRFHVLFPPIGPGLLQAAMVLSKQECASPGLACKWFQQQTGVFTWTEGSLALAGPNDEVFEVDRPNGSIVFGDGTNGKIPPCDTRSDWGYEVVVAEYTSGPHDGYVDWVRLFSVDGIVV